LSPRSTADGGQATRSLTGAFASCSGWHDVDDGRLARLGRLLRHAAELGRVLDAPAPDTERGGDLRMVGAAETDREIALLQAALLAGLDPAMGGVRDHHHRQRHA
jgi:hypothetical protein